MVAQGAEAKVFRETLDSVFAGPAYRWGEMPAPMRLLRTGWDRLVDWLVALRADNPLAYRLLIVGLLLALLLILAHAGFVVWRTARAARGETPLAEKERSETRDAAWHLREADRAAAAGRLTEALQLAFVGLALTLHNQGIVQYHASKTPAEYVGEARLAQGDRDRLRSLVGILYTHVFGGRALAPEEYRRWREAGESPWHAAAG